MSTAGLSTKAWGPSGWSFLFSCVMGGYPPVIDTNNKEHRSFRRHFKRMFISLGYTMPCIFCRQSYKIFYKELPIERFMDTRLELMHWLYLIRDKVNKKLIEQERECYRDERAALKIKYNQQKISPLEYRNEVQRVKRNTLLTRTSPPFIEVLDKYESIRAVCSKGAKTCSLPKRN
jgi:hypothetical protein